MNWHNIKINQNILHYTRGVPTLLDKYAKEKFENLITGPPSPQKKDDKKHGYCILSNWKSNNIIHNIITNNRIYYKNKDCNNLLSADWFWLN